MLETKFSKEEMTLLCQLLKKHGTDCATLVDVLELANSVVSNDAIATYKHVILLKEFGIIEDRTLLCHTCVSEVIDHHLNTCEEHKKRMDEEFFIPCPDEHYNYDKCYPAVWMVDSHRIYVEEEKAALNEWRNGNRDMVSSWYDNVNGLEVVKRQFNHDGRTKWLEENFPDIPSEIRFNPWMGFLCEKHIGNMRPFSNRIIEYR